MRKLRNLEIKAKEKNDLIESQLSGFLGVKPAAVRSSLNHNKEQLANFEKG